MTKDDIKKIRSKAGLTQREFGERVGVSVRAVQKWERGERNASKLARRAIYAEFKEEVWDGDKADDQGK